MERVGRAPDVTATAGSVQVPPERVWLPGPGRAVPMSAQVQALGQTPGGACGGPWVTLSKAETVRLVELLASAASPATSGPGRFSATVEPGR